MADELNLEEGDKVESVPISRFKEISKKQIDAEKERAAEMEARKSAELERDNAVRERDFANSFADIIGQYPLAKEHKDEIKSKVLAGYTPDDAAVSVLNKAGKLTPQKRETESPVGGSSASLPSQGTTKSLQELTQEERRQAIIENDSGIMEFLRTGR